MENNQPILDDIYFQQPQRTFQLARHEKRFINYLIDGLIMSGIIRLIEFSLVKTTGWEPSEELELSNILSNFLIGAAINTVYYCVMEGFFEGRTIGKFITRTKVIDVDGSAPSLKTVLIRSFSRLVPFEALSFLGKEPIGWHDKWSKTRVVEDAK